VSAKCSTWLHVSIADPPPRRFRQTISGTGSATFSPQNALAAVTVPLAIWSVRVRVGR
jgi:hypothetical protein